jgi:hypothetical protein
MDNKTSVAYSPTSRTVTLVMPIEHFDVLADFLYSAVSYGQDNYGSGWDPSSEDDREAKRVWTLANRLSKQFQSILDKLSRS